MKVGDLVVRSCDLVRKTVGHGIVINSQDLEDSEPYYQVVWLEPRDPRERSYDRAWYDRRELEILNSSR